MFAAVLRLRGGLEGEFGVCNQKVAVRLVVLALSSLLFGCNDDWSKRRYCSDLGREVSGLIDKDHQRNNDKENAWIMHTSHFRWTYCPPTNQCLMQERSSSVATRSDDLKMKTIRESIVVRDLMTNETVLSRHARTEDLSRDAVKAFESARDKLFPGCFRSEVLSPEEAMREGDSPN